jgi:DNA-binding NtrC family response regulator/tetratricopeptide (TPR) repeat protein
VANEVSGQIPDPRELAELLLRAAESHLERGEAEEALRCARKAVELAEAHGWAQGEVVGRRLLGDALARRGRIGEAREHLERAGELASSLGDEGQRARILFQLGDLLRREGELDRSRETLEQALALLGDSGDDAARASLLEVLGTVLRLQGQMARALECFQEACRIRESLGDELGLAESLNGLGNTLHRMGLYQEALNHHRRSVGIYERLGDRRGLAKALNNLGSTLLEMGDFGSASDSITRAKGIFEELGDRQRVAYTLNNLALLASYTGEPGLAERRFKECLEIWKELRDRSGEAIALNNLANVAISAGRMEEALEWARRSVEVRRRLGQREGLAKSWFNVGRALVALGRLEEAREVLQEMTALAEDAPGSEIAADAKLLESALALASSDPEWALRAAREAQELLLEGGSPLQQGESLRLQGEAHLALEQLEEARVCLLKSENTFHQAKDIEHLARCRFLLGCLFLQVGAHEAAAERLRRAASHWASLGNRAAEWECLMKQAEAEWPLSRRQARATLVAAGDLARRLGRPELVREVEALSDRLLSEGKPAMGAAMEAAAWATLAKGLRGAQGAREKMRVVLRFLWETSDAEAVLGYLVRPKPHVAECRPAGAPWLEAMEDLAKEAADGGRTLREHLAPELQAVAVPIPGGIRPTGALVVVCRHAEGAGGEAWSERIGAVAEILALALVSGEEGRTFPDLRPAPADVFEGIVGRSPEIQAVFRTIEKVAPTDVSVLIQGESGTGKELVAKAIHARSRRCKGPFVAISCPSIPKELIEAELFGHEKGAFTGAHISRPGQIEAAHKGTLFLDEIGDMDLGTQSKLLRFLQEREFRRIGGLAPIRVDIRILAATSRDLEEEIRAGRFREDLYYRICVVPISLPPLRSRKEDIPLLVEHFIDEWARREGRPRARVAPEVMEALMAYSWPGNVRELRNTVESMLTMCTGEVITTEHLPPRLQSGLSEAVELRDQELRPGETLEARLMSLEGAIIRKALEEAGGNQSEAARRLGISLTKLRYRMRRYGLLGPQGKTGRPKRPRSRSRQRT